MAAKQLDEMWDSQVSVLNTSYASTVSLLEEGKVKDAYDEFHANFAQAVKKIYSEAPQTYPERFRKIDDWCSWIKGLYITSAKADKALAAGNADDAKKLLASMRDRFYKLHLETKTEKAPDFVYALFVEVQKDSPEAGLIKGLDAKLADAKSVSGVTPTDFAKAKSDFNSKVAPLLADDKVEADELPTLRSATDALYKAYGMRFE